MDVPEKDKAPLHRIRMKLDEPPEMEAAEHDAPPPVSPPIQAPSSAHLDFGAELIAEKPLSQKPEGAGPEDASEPIRHVRPASEPTRTGRATIVLRFLCVIAALAAVNEFYGRPFLDARWRQLGTYRTIVGSFVGSKLSTLNNQTEQPRKMKVTGIVHSSDKPSAIVGTQIVYVGDIISGATVLDIDMDGVTFEADGQAWTQKVR